MTDTTAPLAGILDRHPGLWRVAPCPDAACKLSAARQSAVIAENGFYVATHLPPELAAVVAAIPLARVALTLTVEHFGGDTPPDEWCNVDDCPALAVLAKRADMTAGDLAAKFIRDGIQRQTGKPIGGEQ